MWTSAPVIVAAHSPLVASLALSNWESFERICKNKAHLLAAHTVHVAAAPLRQRI